MGVWWDLMLIQCWFNGDWMGFNGIHDDYDGIPCSKLTVGLWN